jgi:alkylhydroperoxidase family enzyme
LTWIRRAAAPSRQEAKLIDFKLYTKEDAPAGSRETLGAIERQFGFVPNVLRQLAEAPAALGGAAQLLGLLEQSSLTLEEQQVVLLEVARQNTSEYCVAANSTVAQVKTVPADVVEGVRRGGPLADSKLEALRRFVAEMVRQRGNPSEEATRRFLDAGYGKAQVLDVILGIATETMASYTDRVSGVPLDHQFQPNAWAPSGVASSARS